jgi:hypothetical protein
VGAVQAWDLTEQLAAGRVHHHHAGLARDEEPVADGIERHVVPAAVTAKLQVAGHMVGRRLGGLGDERRMEREQDRELKRDEEVEARDHR